MKEDTRHVVSERVGGRGGGGKEGVCVVLHVPLKVFFLPKLLGARLDSTSAQ